MKAFGKFLVEEIDPDWDKVLADVELHAACTGLEPKEVKRLLAAGADPKSKLPNGNTPLGSLFMSLHHDHHDYDDERVSRDFTKILDMLLKAGTDLGPTSQGTSPIFMAFEYNVTTDVMWKLLNAGVDVDHVSPDGTTLLHHAAERCDDLAILSKILKMTSLDVDTKGGYLDRTPLHWAISNHCVANVKLLLDAGADPFIVGSDGQTAYSMAKKEASRPGASSDFMESARVLDDHINSKMRNSAHGDIPLVEAAKGGSSRSQAELDDWLHSACEEQHAQDVLEALAAGADAKSKTSKGDTALTAFLSGVEWENISEYVVDEIAAVIEKLLELGTDLGPGADGYVPAFLVPVHSTLFWDIVEAGTDLDYVAPDGLTILHVAADVREYSNEGESPLSKIMKRTSLDVNLKGGHKNQTPLYWAVLNHHEPNVKLLLDAGADPFIEGDGGSTAYGLTQDHDWSKMALLSHKSPAITKILDDHIASQMKGTQHGDIPLVEGTIDQSDLDAQLHQACRDQDWDGVEEALTAGADPRSKTPEGDTPLTSLLSDVDWADLEVHAYGLEEIIEVLLKAGTDLGPGADGDLPAFMVFDTEISSAMFWKMVEAGSDVDYIGPDNYIVGKTFLHLTANTDPGGEYEKFLPKILKITSLDVNIKGGTKDQTPLYWAVDSHNPGNVKLLLDAGADPLIAGTDGKTAYDLTKDNFWVNNPQTAHRAKEITKILDDHIASQMKGTQHGDIPLVEGTFSKFPRRPKKGTVAGYKTLPLFDALAKRMSADRFMELVDAGNDPLQLSPTGQTLLHVLILYWNPKIFRKLMELGLDVNAKANRGRTALHRAVDSRTRTSSMIPMLRILLNAGADPTITDDYGFNALHGLVDSGVRLGGDRLAEAAKMLMEAGADPTAATNNGSTAISMAQFMKLDLLVKVLTAEVATRMDRSEHGDIQLLEFKIEKDETASAIAKVEWMSTDKDWTGLINHIPQLVSELKSGLIDVSTDKRIVSDFIRIFDHGTQECVLAFTRSEIMDLVTRDCEGLMVLAAIRNSEISADDLNEIIEVRNIDVSEPTERGVYYLSVAARNNSLPKVKLLMSLGADVNAIGSLSRTALFEAIMGPSTVSPKMISCLLEAGADPNIVCQDGMTALHAIISRYHDGESAQKILVDLLEAGGDPLILNDKGKSALDVAAKENKIPFVEILRSWISTKMKGTQHGDIPLVESSSDNDLIRAVENNNLARVKRLIKGGADLEAKGNLEWTALHNASWNGYLEIVKELIKARADVEVKNNKGWTALHFASSRGHFEVVKELIQSGADLFALDNDGKTPLDSAGDNGTKDLIRKMIKDRMEGIQYGDIPLVESADDLGNKMLELLDAAEYGDLAKAKKLIAAGADLEVKDDAGSTSLHYAAAKGRLAVLKELIQAGANLDAKNDEGWTPLHFASRNRQTEAMKELIAAGADLFAMNNEGKTPLEVAKDSRTQDLIRKMIKDRMEGMQYGDIPLLESKHKSSKRKSKDVDAIIQADDVDGLRKLLQDRLILPNSNKQYSAIMNAPIIHVVAKECKDPQMIDVLVEAGANVNKTGWDDKTAVHIAARFGNVPMIRALAKHKAYLNWSNAQGYTPLSEAIRECEIEAVEVLIELGAPPEGSIFGNSLLQWAIYDNDITEEAVVKIAKLLIGAGLDVNVEVPNNGTLLHCAAITSRPEVFELLLDEGADIDAVDSMGKSPLDVAKDRDELMKVLTRRMGRSAHGDIVL